VSTDIQEHALQIDALQEAGVPLNRIIVETASGAKARPMLVKLVARLRADDELVVWKLDRLGRNAAEVAGLAETLQRRKIRLRILTLGIDTTTPTGYMVLGILAHVAQVERAFTLERSKAGRAAAVRRGVKMGRKPKTTAYQRHEIIERVLDQGESLGTLALSCNVSRTAVHRIVTAERKRRSSFGIGTP
jgi:DNA invertase Pin-like site-specific DNA recombinase